MSVVHARQAAAALAPADDDSELLDVVNASNSPTRTAPRAACHRDGLLHRAAHVMLFRAPVPGRAAPQLLLQRRSARKRIGPGLLDLSVAEHVSAGESPKTAAARGLAEELGLRVDAGRLVEVRPPLLRQMEYAAAGVRDNEFVALYAVEYRGAAADGDVAPDEAEVSAVEWRDVGDVMEMAAAPLLTPWFSEELRETDLAAVAARVLA